MQIEANQQIGPLNDKHDSNRIMYFSRKRTIRFNTRLSRMYLLVSKVLRGDDFLFFVTDKKQTEQNLLEMRQEAAYTGDTNSFSTQIANLTWHVPVHN